MSNVKTVEATRVTEGTHESNVLYNRALEMVNRNRVSAARKDLEKALQICPRHPAYLSLYGLCIAMQSQDYDAARKLCERAIKMSPRDPLNRVNLGRVLRLEGNNSAAHEEFLAAWRMDPSHPAPATELSRMGIRRPPVLRFLPRSHWANVRLGRLRALLTRSLSRVSS